jgi:hypothetical protein
VSTFAPFSPEQLQALDDRFGRIHVHTPAARKKPSWARPDAPEPEPAYQVVFRPCVPGEWDNIMGQANGEKTKASSPKNLAMATIVAVSFDGKQTIVDLDLSQRDLRTAQKPVRDALAKLLMAWCGIPEAVADGLAELNGVVREQTEKD